MITHDGHVEWACMDHFPDAKKSLNPLQAIVDEHRGKIDKNKIEIGIKTKEAALRFYNALNAYGRVRELSIQLLWDATLSDLRTFGDAISKANIERLTIDGSGLQGPLLDIPNRSRRFNPIIELMANGKIKSLRLVEFKDFYQRVDAAMRSPMLMLQALNLDFSFSFHDPAKSVFKSIVKGCPVLTELSCKCDHLFDVFKCIRDIAPQITTLILKNLRLYCKASLFKDSVSDLHVTVSWWFKGLLDSELEFLNSGHLTSLTVSRIQDPDTKNELDTILHKNSGLTELHIMSDLRQYCDIVEVVKEKWPISPLGCASAVKTLVLSPSSEIANQVEDIVVHMTVTFGDSTDSIVTVVDIKSAATSGKGVRSLDDILLHYGCSIQRLHTSSKFDDEHASHLATTLQSGQSKLTSLSVNPSSLNPEGLNCVEKIVKYSKHLSTLAVSFDRKVGHEPRVTEGIAKWVAEMVKRSPSSTTSSEPASSPASSSAEDSWTPLNEVRLWYMELHPVEWETVLGAMDFSTLKRLSVENTNFAFAQLEQLVDKCAKEGASLELYVKDADLVQTVNREMLQKMIASLEGKARHLKITGL
ncbi:hypothetical protein BGZ52_002582 [Haplosporangium bisporale]|nr:hypothetical protein BGZ52_002582 [Haplosporangium bisporale]